MKRYSLTYWIIILIMTIQITHSEESRKSHSGHHHDAPHGGTLVVFGDEFAHIELLLEKKMGNITCFILDGEAKNGVRISQEQIKLKIQYNNQKIDVILKGMANILTGETANDTSQFEGKSPELIMAEEFHVTMPSITIKGVPFRNMSFPFPQGNESSQHGHGNDHHNHEHHLEESRGNGRQSNDSQDHHH